MISITEIDLIIEEILLYLESIQNNDGSFTTMINQPFYNPDKNWFAFPNNAPYDTATTLLPLLNIRDTLSTRIIQNGSQFLINNKHLNKLWTYAYLSEEYKIPYDTDSTSLCSFILSKQGYNINNKLFLNSLINDVNYFPFYIWPSSYNKHISLKENIRLFIYNKKIAKLRPILQDDMRVDDYEFGSTCINLMYTGLSAENQKVWQQIEEDFDKNNISILYYINQIHATYLYARMHFYNNADKINSDKVGQFFNQIDLSSTRTSAIFDEPILIANSILFCNAHKDYTFFLENIWENIRLKQYKSCKAFYSGNVKTDFQPNTLEPHSYFGSHGITASLYLEFLNTYRKRTFGLYYGENS